ncbi:MULTISPECIES: hypothetical protein [Capnocytophaga]|nr:MULTISPECIES: hypothetical protein [Capnocytophaga]ATA72708.1 toxin-antitoxin system, antitoxin component [Capnocytophaga sp. H4358]GIM60988.1 hypothetical protein CAPN008_10380 [Capnocytophaga canis]CEN45067.1 conserved hypothetical protein [Capnocytophaga canis]
MNTITLKRNLSFQEYQLLTQILDEMGIEIERKIDSFALDKQDLENIAKSNEEAKQGLLISSEEVRNRALKLCTK